MPSRRSKHKFKAIQTIRDNIKFQSKLEASYYDNLKLRQTLGDVIFFLRQTPFHLPGGVTYRIDFQVFLSDGTVEFIDVKGKETEVFIIKKKIVESIYPIEIIVLKKGQF